MDDTQQPGLSGRRLLVVEDEYIIAADLVRELRRVGAEVVGPVRSVGDALSLIEAGEPIDGAVLDINLGGERVYPVADALEAQGVPYVFATGYHLSSIPAEYADRPHCEKPVMTEMLARHLSRARG
jgi:CheY-like chemotaxis protein